MKVTADTITDEQIRELRDFLVRLAKKIGHYDEDARDEAIADAGTCTRALATSTAMRLEADTARRKARARCAEMINARWTDADTDALAKRTVAAWKDDK